METKVTHEEKYQQFTMVLPDKEEAELAYSTPAPQILDFTHTFVPENARGKGIANKLIEAGLEFAAQNKFKVRASCPVVARFLERHPQHQELLEQEE
ncbi:N-acetyltransferase [Pontibacter qinzhouensis]|uniref:N-acetyltransferase n=1 Tax=Pontibacter qinzhouensis TaxID=2603253 RepID=A0A5C8J1G9_9BACT|nr:GNAT family N-acetyltransferase [Pontibacter qinzhouensis]TXK28597.1 N-acetyltransferase [Pontibacter qinzhouensis]